MALESVRVLRLPPALWLRLQQEFATESIFGTCIWPMREKERSHYAGPRYYIHNKQDWFRYSVGNRTSLALFGPVEFTRRLAPFPVGLETKVGVSGEARSVLIDLRSTSARR